MIRIKDILHTENIVKAIPSDTLSNILPKLSSSHGAAFVFDKQKKFVGLINPYHSVIKSSLPGNAKVEHCLIHPARIYTDYSLKKVIHLMIGSKVHYLPVFDDKDIFKGVVSARQILAFYQNDPKLKIKIDDVLHHKNKPLLTVYEGDTIDTALHLFKTYKISKLVVINKDFKLKGVLSYFDLIHFLITPKHREALGEREGGKNHFYNQKVNKFAKTLVLTLSPRDSLQNALQLVLEKKIGSIIVVNDQKQPVGILTTRDFFHIITQPYLGLKFQIFTKNLSKSSKEIVQAFFKPFSIYVQKTPHITAAKLSVKEEKPDKLYKVSFSVSPDKGKSKVMQREGSDLKVLLSDVKKGVKESRTK